jgi:hypothetical protein
MESCSDACDALFKPEIIQSDAEKYVNEPSFAGQAAAIYVVHIATCSFLHGAAARAQTRERKMGVVQSVLGADDGWRDLSGKIAVIRDTSPLLVCTDVYLKSDKLGERSDGIGSGIQ